MRRLFVITLKSNILADIRQQKGRYSMAIPTNIKTLLSGEVVEWARIEYKETWDAGGVFENDLCICQ